MIVFDASLKESYMTLQLEIHPMYRLIVMDQNIGNTNIFKFYFLKERMFQQPKIISLSYLESVLQPWYKKHFLLVIQPLSTFLKSVSMSEHEDEDHSGLSDHMPKGNFVIPWRGAKKKRERKQYCQLGNDVERRNVPIISHSSVSAPGLFPALFKAVEILTCSHHSLLGIH